MTAEGRVTAYQEFLAAKAQSAPAAGFEPTWMPPSLYGFQELLTSWAVRQGRGALFADCGLGKTPMQLSWAQNVHLHTGRPVLVVTPLAVSAQTQAEARKFGIDAAVSRDGTVTAPVTITNYERLSRFRPGDFGGVACDESSAIKAFDGVLKATVTEFLRCMPYRLLATATAAPNDYVELGTSSEALGYLGHMDMLARFFTNSARTSAGMKGKWREPGDGWRFKGHAEEAFWRWVASWARAARRPSDLGFPDDGFVLPALEERRHVVEARVTREGTLFDAPAANLHEEREESRRTLAERCEKAAALLGGTGTGIAWCQLNAESERLARAIPGATELTGTMPPEQKEEILAAFSAGEIRVLVTKPSIGAWGLNWQHCNRMTYFPTHSYEQYYQAVRRCWRFGQQRPVAVEVITTPGGANIFRNLQRKAAQADEMFSALTRHMRDALAVGREQAFACPVEVPSWI